MDKESNGFEGASGNSGKQKNTQESLFSFTPIHDVSDKSHYMHCPGCNRLRREIERRGTHFSDTQVNVIAGAFRGAISERYTHTTEGVTFDLKNGGQVVVTHNRIFASDAPDASFYKGAAKAIRYMWGGAFSIGLQRVGDKGEVIPLPAPNQQARLMAHAMAAAYLLDLRDGWAKSYPLDADEKAFIISAAEELKKGNVLKYEGPGRSPVDPKGPLPVPGPV